MDRLVGEVCALPGVHRVFGGESRRDFGSRFHSAVIYVQEPVHVLILVFGHFQRCPDYWVDWMDFCDAAVVRLSEIFPRATVITTDSAHFTVYRRFCDRALACIHPAQS